VDVLSCPKTTPPASLPNTVKTFGDTAVGKKSRGHSHGEVTATANEKNRGDCNTAPKKGRQKKSEGVHSPRTARGSAAKARKAHYERIGVSRCCGSGFGLQEADIITSGPGGKL